MKGWVGPPGRKRREFVSTFFYISKKIVILDYENFFHFLDKDIMRKIITTMIRPKLEYTEVIRSPHKKKHVLKLERIQRIATKMVPDLENLTHEERLKEIHLTKLKERRERKEKI